jgi:hypothetical protein
VQKELSDISEEEIETFYKTASENVKARRIALNMSQLDLALKLKGQALKIYLKFKLIESLVVKALK